MFLNLDPVFDSNLLSPIKDIWSSHPCVKTKQNKKSESAKSAASGADQLESLINMLSMAAASNVKTIVLALVIHEEKTAQSPQI